MSPLTQAISQGFSAEQILEYFLRKSPKYAKEIQKALSQGFSADQILKYLNKGRKGLNEFEGELTEHEKTRKSDIDKQKNLERNIGKGALALGTAALGAYGLSRAGQAAIPEVLPAIQETFKPREEVEIDATPKIAHQAKQIEFQPPNQLIEQAKSPESPIAPGSIPQIPLQIQQSQVDFGQLLDRIGVKNKVDALRESNPPEVISKVIKYGLPKSQIQQLESQLQMPLDQVIQGYLANAPAPETMQQKIAKGVPFGNKTNQLIEKESEITPLSNNSSPIQENRFKDVIEEGRAKFEHQKSLLDIPEKPKDRSLKLERGSSVLLPDGNIGEIEDVKQGIAKVKVGDRIRNKKLEELMESPKEAALAALELIKSFTPETLRSSHHALNTYDPVTKSAQFLFHNGEGYIVEDISPEEYERLSTELEEAKTTGENKIGAWSTGAGSRGAAYNKIIRDFAKPKDQRKPKPFRKIQVGYNLFKEFQRLINEKEE
jgi:hypothetical protein